MTLIWAYAWSLLAFLWQGTLLGLALAAARRLLSNAGPQRRYTACALAMAAMVSAWLWTFASLLYTPTSTGVLDRAIALARVHLPAPGPSHASHFVRSLSAHLALPAWLCFFLTLGLAARILLGLVRARLLVENAGVVTSRELARITRGLAFRLGLRVPVRVLASSAIPAPVVIGWLRPAIVVTPGLADSLEPVQLEAVLAHELAHVLRRDFLANALQSLVEALLFVHPCVWWVSRSMREERELCCDDLAVRVTGSPLACAKALAALEQQRVPAHPHVSLSASGGSLTMRIQRLLQPQRAISSFTRGVLALSLGAATIIGVAALSSSLIVNVQAQATPDGSSSTTLPSRSAGRRPDLACTFYPNTHVTPYSGTPGTCEADASIPERYACRQNGSQQLNAQLACEWKVKRLQRWLHAHPGQSR